ncbi:hypothetical protein Tco_0484930 [Tanacetum coccineum]
MTTMVVMVTVVMGCGGGEDGDIVMRWCVAFGWWYEGGGGDRGGEEGDNDEVLVWCTRSSDGDGGVAAIAGI